MIARTVGSQTTSLKFPSRSENTRAFECIVSIVAFHLWVWLSGWPRVATLFVLVICYLLLAVLHFLCVAFWNIFWVIKSECVIINFFQMLGKGFVCYNIIRNLVRITTVLRLTHQYDISQKVNLWNKSSGFCKFNFLFN